MPHLLGDKRKNKSNLKKALIFITISLMMFAGCTGNYGRLKKDKDINRIFTGYQILADCNYYYSGPKGRPDAIMAIYRPYTLQSTQWTPIDLTPDQLKKWVQSYRSHYGNNTTDYPYGFQILDQNDNPVGIWYSIWNHTTVELKENNHLVIFPPAKKPIHPFDADGRGRRPIH
jgi:hypothetical protein